EQINYQKIIEDYKKQIEELKQKLEFVNMNATSIELDTPRTPNTPKTPEKLPLAQDSSLESQLAQKQQELDNLKKKMAAWKEKVKIITTKDMQRIEKLKKDI